MSVQPTDDELLALWRYHGGHFSGPRVETGTMPQALLLPFLRRLWLAAPKVVADAIDAENHSPMAWRPIETAPKDGREVVLAVAYRAGCEHGVLVGHYMPGGYCIEDHPPIDAGWYFWNGCMFDLASTPTHWLPLPHHPEWRPDSWIAQRQGPNEWDAPRKEGANFGHGHVYPRADGIRARCGGPGICAECSKDAERKRREGGT